MPVSMRSSSTLSCPRPSAGRILLVDLDALRAVAALAVLALLLSSPGAALGIETALVEGRVVSSDGQAVQGARVATLAGSVLDVSSEDGTFSVRSRLPVDLLIEHPSFAPRSVHVAEPARDMLVELELGIEDAVTVRAQQLGSTYSPELLTGTAIDPLAGTNQASTIVDAAKRIAGVAENGQGGIFRVLSIRGVSRQRVLTLFDGVRLTSERRAGVSASFIDPELVGEIDVRRGPASTYLGAGALGGAVEVRPRLYSRWNVALGYASAGDAASQSAGWGDGRFSLGLARRSADDTESPEGVRLFSRYDQLSATARTRLEVGPGELDVLGVFSRGDDIGKSSSDFPSRKTIYPEEEHMLVRAIWSQGDRLLGRVFWHPQSLETRVERDFLQSVSNEAADYGAHFEHRLPRLPLGDLPLDGRLGVDSFQRRGVVAREVTASLEGDVLGDFVSLDDARLEENAVFAVLNGGGSRFSLEGGLRFTDHRQENGGRFRPYETRSQDATTGFLGGAVELGRGVRLLASYGIGQRFPTLTERFYTGVTGRGNVLGNPDLRDETGENLEAGLRWVGQRTALNFAVYRNEIDDYIERIEVGPDLLSFRNLTSGTIEGVELDGFRAFGSAQRARVEWQAHHIDGESALGEPLADIPVDSVRLTGRYGRGRWDAQVTSEWRGSKSEPGPSERVIDSVSLVDAGLAWALSSGLKLRFEATNLLDETYYASADDQGPLAAGRSLGLHLRWQVRN